MKNFFTLLIRDERRMVAPEPANLQLSCDNAVFFVAL